MDKTRVFLPTCILALLSIGPIKAQITQCTTPDRKLGNCVTITKCEAYTALIEKTITAEVGEFLRRAGCGFEGNTPKVCCPESSSQGGNTDVSERNPTPNVNSRLLPDKTLCGVSSEDRIVGGEITELDEFPWMTLIEYSKGNNGRGFYCGGVLISDKYVLTAAHCVKGADLPKTWRVVSVRLGEYDTNNETDCIHTPDLPTQCADPPEDVPVDETIAHEEYNPNDKNQYHDIALLRLARKVKFTDYIKPICLPTTKNELEKDLVGERLTVAGWGRTETKVESNVKLKVQVPVKTNDDCSSKYNTFKVNLRKGQICAGGESGKDSCRGDSGGPLMGVYVSPEGNPNWFVSGIVSFGPTPCGYRDWPGVYSRVSEYMPWIVSKIRA